MVNKVAEAAEKFLQCEPAALILQKISSLWNGTSVMWAKMPDKAFISKNGRNAEAKPEKLEPHNLEMYLDVAGFYHVQGLV